MKWSVFLVVKDEEIDNLKIELDEHNHAVSVFFRALFIARGEHVTSIFYRLRNFRSPGSTAHHCR